MLKREEQEEITREISRYERKSAACIEALRIVQRHRGWISDESVSDIAEFLSLSTADVDGVATFYNLIFRKPVGRHVIFVCDSVSCWIMGGDTLKTRLVERLGIQLGETTKDGSVTLLPIACLGHCERAPTLMIDGEVLTFSRDPSGVDEILARLSAKPSERSSA